MTGPSLAQLRGLHKHKATPVAVLLAFILLWRLRSRKALALLRPRRLTPEEMSQALQRLYREGVDGAKTLLVPYYGRIKEVEIKPTTQEALTGDKSRFPVVPPSHKPNVDKVFVRQLLSILRIVFPSWHSKEVGVVLLHSTFLVLRTVLSVGVARLDGRIVRDLISGNGKGFLRGLGLWFLWAIPSTYTNAMIRYLQSKLSMNLRTRLTRYTHDLYFSSSPSLRYYRINQSNGLEGVDQYITSDIAALCESLSALYGNIMKPSLDMIIFTAQLSQLLGFRGTVFLFANYYLTIRVLRAATPAFGRLAAVEAMLEGEYRTGMSRIARESEEIAFYGGGPRERSIIWSAYLKLIRHINSIYKLRIAYEWTEDFVIKYMWSAGGYILISIPVLFTRRRSVGVQAPSSERDDAVAGRTENYITSRRLLLSLADAAGRLMYAYKDILGLAGHTTRVYSLLSTLHNLSAPFPYCTSSNTVALTDVDVVIPGKADMPLIRALNIKLEVGEHLMITGSNGVGKTAVARVIAGLWEAGGGDVTRPDFGVKGILVVPQRAYMVVGTLLDQIIYPHSYPQFLSSGKTEADLMEILQAVHLAYLPEREGGWSARKEWRDILSGGEKQRMSLARVFYHRPTFAVLDECTSAVSSDVEGSMYEHAKRLGITLITISLRPSLAKYHTHLLTIHQDGDGEGTGHGSWTLTRIGTAEERMSIDRQIITLEAKLAEVSKWEERLKELDRLLRTPLE